MFRPSQRFLPWGFGSVLGFACFRFVGFKPFWPLALVQQALPAIFLAALRRFGGAALLRGLRPSPIQGAPFWPSGLTLRSSGPAFCGPLTLAVSLRKTRIIQAHGSFTGIHLLKRLSAGVFAVCRASPLNAAPVSSLFGLQPLCSKRHQLSFFKQCVASVAHCFFAVCARRQSGASRFGFWV